MKTLTLLRHAKSDQGTAARDFDRPLNERGRHAARTMGAYIAAQGLVFDVVLASPAVRVRETLDEVARGYGSGLAVRFDQRIYLAMASTLLDLVRETDEAVTRLLLVGHNPGLEELALGLDAAGGALRDAVRVKYPTGALAEIALEGSRWSKLTTGRIVRFVRPPDLNAAE